MSTNRLTCATGSTILVGPSRKRRILLGLAAALTGALVASILEFVAGGSGKSLVVTLLAFVAGVSTLWSP